MKRGQNIEGLVERFEGVQKELLDLLAYVKTTRSSLDHSTDQLSDASDKLMSISGATEKAAHNLLTLVERAMACDESAMAHLEALENGAEGDSMKKAVEGVSAAQDERMNILTEMMQELSFQDLTCQTLEKVTAGLNDLESRILHILDPESAPPVETPPPGVHAGSMSGLSRLEENQQGGSRQDLVDQLLNGL